MNSIVGRGARTPLTAVNRVDALRRKKGNMNDAAFAGVPAQALSHRCDAAQIPFETTAEVDAPVAIIGQERAARALAFGMGIAGEDYNVFVMGPSGTGRHTLVREALARRAESAPPPSDWVYVNNFASPHQPLAIELPPGLGARLKDDMERLVRELRAAVPAIFQSEDYSHRVEKIDQEFNERRDKAVNEIGADAERQQISLLRTPAGFAFAPTKDGAVLASEDFDRLPDEERERIALAISQLQERLEKAIRDAMRARKERGERVNALNREMVLLAVDPLVEELTRRYADFPKVVVYLHAVRDDTVLNAESFQQSGESESALSALGAHPFNVGLRRYAVNLLVDRSHAGGPEVVFCDHPTYANLVGRIEHIQHLGTLVTDFTLLKAGDLHRANGGYLVVDALKVLMQPFAWEALKRALTRREVRLEPASELLGVAATVGLEPEAIPLAVKVVLVGERRLYYLLEAYDPDFQRLFKVVADFEESLERDTASCDGFARMIAGLAKASGLLPFDRGAVARVIDEAARRAADSRKLSADVAALSRLLRESDFLAREAKRATVGAPEVCAAVDAQRARSDRLKRRVQEAIQRGTILIDTSGAKVAQVNGLAYVPIGECPFAEPVRITATARVGEGQVIDVQREARLGGAIHSKGVLILSQFLAARFSGNRPHCLAASVAFEQTYGEVEGDSASLAELCALLSSLADLPVRQSFAVTGSVNQLGEVQAIGGVNEKIEGFFEICRARGLTGEHGVIIPAANLEHLMLREDVVEAAREGLFQVHAVATVDQAIELLTGVAAGSADFGAAGPQHSVNARVAQRLREFARLRAAAGVSVPRGARGRRAVRVVEMSATRARKRD